MNYEIIVKPTFQREAKRMAKHYASFKEDFALLIDDLEKNPQLGTDLGHGLRKVRMKITAKGKGKRWRCKSYNLYCGDFPTRCGVKPSLYL